MTLRQIVLYIRVLLVHVRHRRYKPAFDHFLFIRRRGIRIENSLILVRGLGIFRPFIKPIRHGFVFHRPMVTADMIGYDIKNQFHPAFMQLLAQLDIGIIASKTWINMIGLGICITMIGS
ncbi:hypothetical protein D3C76_1441700 [compost metagenome]